MSCEILVLYFSRSNSCAMLAEQIALGVASEGNASANVRRVPQVRAVNESVTREGQDDLSTEPPYVTQEDLERCAGLALGAPSYFGVAPAAMKYLLDESSSLWFSRVLSGKPACVFTSSATMHGGNEAALLSLALPLLHHGMVLLGIPYSQARLNSTQTGGTPYGASHIAGMNESNKLSNDERSLSFYLGQRLVRAALALQSIRI